MLNFEFELLSQEPMTEVFNAKKVVAEYRKRKSEEGMLTQAKIDLRPEDEEPQGSVWARIFWRHRKEEKNRGD